MKLRYIAIGIVLTLTIGALVIVGHYMAKSRAIARIFEAARAAYQKNDFEAARTHLLTFAEKDKTREEVYKMLGEIAEKQGNYGDAVEYWKTAAALNPLGYDSIIRQARAAAKDTDVETAFRLLDPLYNSAKLDKDNLFFYGLAAGSTAREEPLANVIKALQDQKAEGDALTALRGIHTMLSRKPDEAQTLLEAAAAAQDPEVRLVALRGLIALSMYKKDYDRCEKLFADALAIDPRQMAWPYAQYCLERGRPEIAVDYLQKEVQTRPRNIISNLQYAEVLTETGNAPGLKTLREALPKDDNAYVELSAYIHALECFVRDDRTGLATQINRVGRFSNRPLYRLMDLTVEATAKEPDLQKLTVIARDYMMAVPTEATRKRVMRLLTPWLPEFLNRKDLASAGLIAQVLLETRELNPQQALAARRTVLAAQMEAKDITAAISAARAVLQAEPADEQALAALVECLPQTGRIDEAIQLLKRLPDSPLRRVNEALLAERQGKTAEAQAIWKTIPLDTPTLRLRYATFLASKGDAAALSAALGDLQTNPEFAYDVAKLNLIAAYRLKDPARTAPAKAALLATLAPQAKYADRYAETGLLLASAGELAEAEAMWRKALDLNPTHRLSLVNLSNILAARGDHTQAEALADKALKAYPDWEPARDCHNRRQQEAALRADAANAALRAEERARLEKEAQEAKAKEAAK